MKKCPYCAEEIQDEAIKCRWCGSDLTGAPQQPQVEPQPPAETVPRVGEGALRFSHSGHRYLLGYGPDFFGIWDRQSTGGPVTRFPRTDEGWNEAWNQFSGLEPKAVEVPHGGTPAPDMRAATGTFRSLQGRGMWAVGLLALTALFAVVDAVFWAIHIGTLNEFRQGLTDYVAAQKSEDIAFVFWSLTIFMLLPTGIVWLLWQYRAHSNLRALGVANLSISPGWAVGWWFIPFANIVMPYLAVRELWKASDPEAGAIEWKARRGSAIVVLWWTVRLATQALFQIGTALGTDSPGLTSTTRSSAFLVAADLVLAVWAALAIMIVRGVGARQEAKYRRLASWAQGLATTP